jgi:hypothetical protein
MVLSFKKSPAAIGGLSLANFGMAIMIHTVSTLQFESTSTAMLGFVYAFILLGVLSLLIYIIRFASDPVAYFRSDFSSPSNISSVGTFTMAFCLMGKATHIVDFPASMSASIVYIGAVIQAVTMIPFFISCWKTNTWPEPFWNNAVHSSLFTAVCLRGDDKIAVVCRGISVAFGLIFLLPNFSIMTVRTLLTYGKERKVVTNNPGIVMLQSCCSITCSGWLIAPLTKNATTGIGGIVGHVLFALSTFGFCCAMCGAYQRRGVLINFGECPSWVSITFPNANTALAAGLYLKTHPKSPYVLFVWTLILSSYAAIWIVAVNILYLRNWYYLFSDTVPEATEAPDNYKDTVKLGTVANDLHFGMI